MMKLVQIGTVPIMSWNCKSVGTCIDSYQGLSGANIRIWGGGRGGYGIEEEKLN